MSELIFAIALPWMVLAVGCWIGYQLIRQNGRILIRLEALEQQLGRLANLTAPQPQPPSTQSAAAPVLAGLPVGTDAPAFRLPDLSGALTSLSRWRGRRVLLTFFNPQCGFCTQMAPDLAALPIDTDNGQPIPVVVSTGDLQQNQQLVREYGLRCPVLLQKEMEVASAFHVGGTPMGYLLDEAGRIASPLAIGAQAVLALASSPTVSASEESLAGTSASQVVHKGNRPLSESHINRNGLSAGTPAPPFRLPRVGGGDLSLEQYRGQRVLVVFSDPDCGPCDHLAPQLEQLHRRRPDVQVLMISRGEVEENRRKISQQGLTFPVVLQRQWEISRLYAMFGTPIAYLIDEQGIIAADVASGADAILALSNLPAAFDRREFVRQ